MREIAKSASMGLTLALLVGCADTPVQPRANVESEGPSLSLEGQTLQRPELDLSGWEDLSSSIPVHLVTPEAASNIGTGSAIIITIPGEGRFGCTANFVWTGQDKRFLGSAGHCFLPGDRSATHGPGADYDASGVLVDVCVDGCEGNFRSNQITGTWVRLGEVAYARQNDQAGEGVGHDFGVVEIPREFRDYVRLDMPVWGGPTGSETLDNGEYGCHYGNGVLVGETVVTKARVGVGSGSFGEYWMGNFAGAFGDSGSGMVACTSDGTSFHGRGAAGVLTHLGIGLDGTATGVIFGTTIERSIAMAEEANLKLTLTLPKK